MKKLAFALLFAALLSVTAYADMAEELGLPDVREAVPDSAEDVLGDWDILEDDAQSALEKLYNYAMDKLSAVVKEVLRPAAQVMAVVVLCSVSESIGGRAGFDYIGLGGCLAVAAISASDMNSLVQLGRETMTELSDFSKALLPTLTTAASAAGAATSAPVKYAAAALFLDVLINAANTLVFPLICAYLAAAIAQSALGDERLTGSVKLLKWACRTIMVALVTAFTLYLNLTGIVASSGDALASKAAKTALSAALPVVGSIISDAAGSIVSGAGMIRSAVGVFGLIAVLCVCLLPFLRLGVRYLVFKAAAALSSVIGGGRLSRLIDAVGDACGMILSLVGVEAIFIYISIISLVKAVSG